MLSLLLPELGGVVDELLLDDGLLLEEPDVPAAPDAPDWSLEPLVPVLPLMDELPLLEPVAPGVVLLLEELGLVVSVEEDDELGDDGVVVVVADGVVVLLVPDLLRSQPVTAAVATASTATKGMSLFMTSPFRVRLGV